MYLAHDLRNILMVMAICVDRLEAESPTPLAAALSRNLESALALVEEMVAPVSSALPKSELVDLNRFVQERAPTFRWLAAPDVEIEVNLAPGVCRIALSPLELERIMLNLVLNALNAMPRGGVLGVSTALVDVPSALRPGSGLKRTLVRLTVTDTGGGPRPRWPPQVWQPGKDQPSEMWFGLASVEALAQRGGGRIYRSVDEGVGSALHVEWPLAR
jgi:signal transduction histidine kinase